MASHVVGPFQTTGRRLTSSERRTLESTAEWTFTLLETPGSLTARVVVRRVVSARLTVKTGRTKGNNDGD